MLCGWSCVCGCVGCRLTREKELEGEEDEVLMVVVGDCMVKVNA